MNSTEDYIIACIDQDNDVMDKDGFIDPSYFPNIQTFSSYNRNHILTSQLHAPTFVPLIPKTITLDIDTFVTKPISRRIILER